jgi:hypothetical protein
MRIAQLRHDIAGMQVSPHVNRTETNPAGIRQQEKE